MSTKPSFATPLPQSPRSPILEWRFPKPFSQYVLTGRSRAAWHTSFVIPQLNLLLDAGLCVNKLRPKHVFLTHGHNDHVLLTPAFVKREDPPDVFCPVEMVGVLSGFLAANRLLNLGGLFGVGGRDEIQEKEEEEDDDDDDDDDEELGEGDTSSDVNGKVKVKGDLTNSLQSASLTDTHITHGVQHGDTIPLRRLKNITATVFKCNHTVPCVGYVFSATTHRLKPEYKSLPGPVLASMRRSGTDLTCPHVTPIFAFLGDTTASTLAAEPEWLREGIPVVITECSFLYEEHKERAAKTKHTTWMELEPVVRRWPATTFVLTHFSLRYREGEVTAFFAGLEDPPGNIVVWADPEA